MRTNKERLTAYMQEHFDNMRNDINVRMGIHIGNQDWHTAKSIEVYEIVLRNIYFSAINWTAEYEQKDIAWLRPDIVEKGFAVTIGTGTFYGSKYPLPYRWRGGSYFEVLYMGEWHDADSSHWDFTDAVVPDTVKTVEDMAFIDGDKQDAMVDLTEEDLKDLTE